MQCNKCNAMKWNASIEDKCYFSARGKKNKLKKFVKNNNNKFVKISNFNSNVR
jgi:hypothetical protein